MNKSCYQDYADALKEAQSAFVQCFDAAGLDVENPDLAANVCRAVRLTINASLQICRELEAQITELRRSQGSY